MGHIPEEHVKPDPLEVVNRKTRSAYNLAAQAYHDLFHDELVGKAYDRALLDRFASYFGNESLLCDAGCGPSGHVGRYLFAKGIPVVGVDISERCIEFARRCNPGMDFQRGDIGNLAFPDEMFDGAIAYYSIIDTPKHFIPGIFRELHRVLKPGGRLLVAVKAGNSEGYITDLLGIKTEIYFSTFTREEVRRYYEVAGFAIEFLEQRQPYDFEIDAERIFAIGRKAS